MRILLIINPIAGSSGGDKQQLAQRLTRRFQERGHIADVAWTAHAGHATQLARQAAEQCQYQGIVAVGGDGTVNEVVQGLAEQPVPMGIIPAGSGNGLARHLELPQSDPLGAADIIAEGHAEAIDLARVEGLDRICACTCGVGFDAATAHRFAQADGRGLITYIRSAATEYRQRQCARYTLTIDNQRLDEQALIVAICNASQWGNNAYIAPEASVKDGRLDVVVVRPASTAHNALTAVNLMLGRLRQSARVAVYHGSHVVVTRQGLDSTTQLGHIDGEPVVMPSRLEVNCLPGQLQVFTPRHHRGITPVVTPLAAIMRESGAKISDIFNR